MPLSVNKMHSTPNSPIRLSRIKFVPSVSIRLRSTEGCRITAHLLVPGWTTTGGREHKPGAWLPDQVVGVLLDALDRGEFYILCPDDEVTPEMDRQRILWAAGDVAESRPALSRWPLNRSGNAQK